MAYAAALGEAARTGATGQLDATAYVELHLTKAHNWVIAWQSLSDPLDPATARVCAAAVHALDDQMHRAHSQAA